MGAVILLGGGLFAYKYFNNANSETTNTSTPAASVKTDTTSSAMPTGVEAQSATVKLTANGFEPKSLTIKAGTKVTWVNNSGGVATVNSDPHPVHTDYSPLNLGNFADGESVSLTFDKPGTYGYHNHLSASEKGTVTIK